MAVTTLAAIAAFFAFQQELVRQQVDHLRDYVVQRAGNEDRRFSDLTSVHRSASAALIERMTALSPQTAAALFDRYYPLKADGTRRSLPEAYDGLALPSGDRISSVGAFISDGRHVSAQDKAMWVAAFSVVPHTGEALRGEYDNFYFFTPQTRLLMYGPARPDHLLFYRRDAPANLDVSHEQLVQLTLPAANPERRTRCTNLQRLVQDNHGERLATACVTPVDYQGRHLGAFGSSIDLTGYFMTAIGNAMPGASNLIVTDKGELVAYPGFATPGRATEGAVARYERDLGLKAVVRAIRLERRPYGVVQSAGGRRLIAYGLLRGPDWYYLVTYPRSAMVWSAMRSASWILIIGLIAALGETALVVLIARKFIAQPLRRLVHAAAIGASAEAADLERRRDEIGLLARTLRDSRRRVDEVMSSLEQRVKERTLQLERANQEKSRFLANMSHELRTPLNGVVAVSEVLAREQRTPRTRELAELIVSSGRLLERVLSDILDFSKIEAGQMRLEEAEFDLRQLISRIAELHRASADAKGLELDWSLDPAAAGVWLGDPVRLTQILSNLLSNAVKFTEQGKVTLAADLVDGALRLRVKDTGIGFSREVGERLFNRFEQADESITRRFGGTGLGLAICRSLAEIMGGSIDASSVAGEGACFTVTLPLRHLGEAGLSEEAAAAAPQAAIPQGDIRVLLAEDHPANQRVVELMLEPLGCQLTIVDDGRKALERLKAEDFDVVLMDMQMPEMDGLSATRALREHERSCGAARTPVIMLTANALDEHIAASRLAGADAHLSKPIRADALITAIAEALSEKEPEAEVA